MSKWGKMLEELGLKKQATNYYVGELNGYKTVIVLDEQNKLFTWTTGISKTEQVTTPLSDLLTELSNIDDVKIATTQNSSVVVKGKLLFSKEKSNALFNTVKETIVTFLDKNGYKTGCFITGELNETLRLTKVNSGYAYYTEAGVAQLTTALEENRSQFLEKKHNMLFGIFGALLGSLAGAILWVIVGRLGYYAWFAGGLGAAAAFALYKKIGGKVTIPGAIISEIILMVTIFAGSVVEWAWRLYDFLIEDGYVVTFIDVLKEMPNILTENSEIAGKFMTDVALGLGITFIVSLMVIVGSYKEQTGKYKIERLED